MPVVRKVPATAVKRAATPAASVVPKATARTYTIHLPDSRNVPPKTLWDYTLLVYGEKGVGKTTLFGQLEDTLVEEWEPHRKNLKIFQYPKADDPPLDWEAHLEIESQLCSGKTRFKRIVIDTFDRMYDAGLRYISAKAGVDHPTDANDYGKTWSKVREEVERSIGRFIASGICVTLISHARQREEDEDRDGVAMNYIIPTCTPQARGIASAICDYAFYYGYTRRSRTMLIRQTEEAWASCGTTDNFLSPEGTPVSKISMGKTPQESIRNLQASFENKIYDFDEPTPADKERVSKLKKKS